MTDKEKIRKEVERLRNLHQMKYQQLDLDADSSLSLVECGKRNLCNELLSFIDSLTECQQVSPVDGDELGKEVERLYSIYHFNAPIGETRFIAKYFANWKIEKALGIADKAYFESCAKIRQQTVDKAAEWLSELDDALFLGYDNDGYPYIDRDGLARDFKKYMED